LQKIAGTGGRVAASLRTTHCTATLFGAAALRNVMPVVTQKTVHKDNNPHIDARSLTIRFCQISQKNRGLAGFPDPGSARPVLAKSAPERPFRSDPGRALH